MPHKPVDQSRQPPAEPDRGWLERLQAREAIKSAILEGAPDCIITIDHRGDVLDFNPAAERTFGYTRAQVVGRSMVDLIVDGGWHCR